MEKQSEFRSKVVFRHVTQELHQGRVLSAMLWANRYLSAEDPLRKALATRARTKAKDTERYAKIRKILEALEKGSTFSELSDEDRGAILSFREPSGDRRILFADQLKRSHSKRRTELRQLLATKASYSINSNSLRRATSLS
ncbi:MAG: hypothetical protein KDD42_04025 [Bdellovibrionales bacterium]|nr:hypothetical protein [Bdellovibrionales bacterium]